MLKVSDLHDGLQWNGKGYYVELVTFWALRETIHSFGLFVPGILIGFVQVKVQEIKISLKDES